MLIALSSAKAYADSVKFRNDWFQVFHTEIENMANEQ